MGADGADDTLVVETVGSIAEIAPTDWDQLAEHSGARGNPFIQHSFLSVLERSGSVGALTGWTPRHLVLRRGGRIIGAAPAYLKAHSFGEYVFDHGWADAYARAGGRYYPKLLCAVPFTPVAGPRLLAEDESSRALVADAILAAAQRLGVSSAHVNFHQGEKELLQAPFLQRAGLQFQWFNRGYLTYDEFLGALSSRKRKALRRERTVAAEGLNFRRITGDQIKEHHWDQFWDFYQDTGARKWGRPYLTREFFSLLGEAMSDRVLLILAEEDGRPVAGALNLIGDEAIFGRYWGRVEERPFLHFEVCYHQAIDYAIEARLARVEAGAQGEHKLARGYEPVLTRSAHWIADPAFREAVNRYLKEERRQVEAEQELIAKESPFRRGVSLSH